MTELKMINRIAEMQEKLDESVMEKAKNTPNPMLKYDFSRLRLALIDEIGELVHELKGDWCWWKKTQVLVDRNKVIEELVDVWHLSLSINNHLKNYCSDDVLEKEYYKDQDLDIIICTLISSNGSYYPLVALTRKLSYTIKEIYNKYIEKNKINYERIANGY